MTLLPLFLFDKTGYTTFHPELVRVVDKTDHFLVRGNIPRDSTGNFCFPILIDSIKAATQITSPFELTIISLLTLGREDEADFIHKLQKSPPPFGHWIWWQVRAHLPHEETDPAILIHQTFEGNLLAFPSLIDLVFKMMHTPSEIPRIIYFHCRHGCNRSSALATAYFMRCGLSFEKAWEKEAKDYLIYEPHELINFLRLYETFLIFNSN